MLLHTWIIADALNKIANDEIEITTKDPYYFICHHIFENRNGITPRIIKLKINEIADNYNLRNESSESSSENEWFKNFNYLHK